MPTPFHRFCLAAPHSGAGKTTLTLGLLTALARRGLKIQPFKCGPDYIDSGHHRRACGVPSRNLDTWMMGETAVRESYARAANGAEVAVIEGVMGLFDGATADGDDGSTAHVARLLDVPVILVVSARGMARSIAALVKGFVTFDPRLRVAGVIANAVSSESHAAILRDALSSAGLPPLLGWLPRRESLAIPERHLGLVADTEGGGGEAWYRELADLVTAQVDLDRLLALTRGPRPDPDPLIYILRADPKVDGSESTGLQDHLNPVDPPIRDSRCGDRPDILSSCQLRNLEITPDFPKQESMAKTTIVRLGLARDEAFHFYYEDNLDLLRAVGVELVPFSPIHDSALPVELAGLYLGGGFPEMFAPQLEANVSMRESVRTFAETGGAIYAECGGLMYLCRGLSDADSKRHAMCGVLPAETRMEKRLHRLGYVEATTLADGPLGPAGTVVRGHEFHWSSVVATEASAVPAFRVTGPRRPVPTETGFRLGRVWASYLHLHFASSPEAVPAWLCWLRARTGLLCH